VSTVSEYANCLVGELNFCVHKLTTDRRIDVMSASVVDRVAKFTSATAVTSVCRRGRAEAVYRMLVGLVGELIKM